MCCIFGCVWFFSDTVAGGGVQSAAGGGVQSAAATLHSNVSGAPELVSENHALDLEAASYPVSAALEHRHHACTPSQV